MASKPKNTDPKKKNVIPQTSYDTFKVYEGQYYKGMKVGGRHKWYYDAGEWKETKRTPDLWEIHYQVNKKRAGRAPEGSGVPIGTEYHWLILTHQIVKKLDANVYSTDMNGLKFKIAYRKAGQEKWSSNIKGQRKRAIQFLHQILQYLEHEEQIEQKTKLLKNKTTPKKLNSKKK